MRTSETPGAKTNAEESALVLAKDFINEILCTRQKLYVYPDQLGIDQGVQVTVEYISPHDLARLNAEVSDTVSP